MSKVKIQGNASGTGTLTISAPNTNTDRSLTLPDTAGEIQVGTTGRLLQIVRTNGNISSSNALVGTSWVEPTTSGRTSITLTSTNPYLRVTFIPGAEMDGSNDRILLRFDSSKNSGSYSMFGREFYLGVYSTGSTQGTSGAFVAYEQVTGVSGDVFTFTFKHKAELGGNAQVEYGQNFNPLSNSNVYCYFIIEEIGS